MKAILTIVLIAFSFGAAAQEVAPKFEKEGDKVKATYFHQNGEIAQQGYFLNQKLDGEWLMFNEEGDKIAKGSYTSGAKTGTWLFWEGEMMKEVDFNDNRIAGVTESKSSLVKN